MRNEINHNTLDVAHFIALAFMLRESDVFQTMFVRSGAFVAIFQFQRGVSKVLFERLGFLMSVTDQFTYERNSLTKCK